VDSPNLGTYQVRAQARSTSGPVFDISGVQSRVITPNGDGLNDLFVVQYDPGPDYVTPTGQIFDLRGAFVSNMVPSQAQGGYSMVWDGKMNGTPVHSGVYVYRIQGGGKTFTGTVVVAR
jgi:gliding motility-associated-like protein